MLCSCGIFESVVRHREPEAVDALRKQKMVLDTPAQAHEDLLEQKEEEYQDMVDILRNQK